MPKLVDRKTLEVRVYPEKGGTFKFMVFLAVGDGPPLKHQGGYTSAEIAHQAGEIAVEQMRTEGIHQ